MVVRVGRRGARRGLSRAVPLNAVASAGEWVSLNPTSDDHGKHNQI
jgi:hypothetical protein